LLPKSQVNSKVCCDESASARRDRQKYEKINNLKKKIGKAKKYYSEKPSYA